MSVPAVSVVIPAYNASGTIEPCIRSVQAAAGEYGGAVGIIVADDRSSDDTREIAERLGCRVVHMPDNGGPARARNAGANVAAGEVLIFVDADTEMRRDTIREAVAALESEGVGAVSGMYEAEPINEGFFPRYYAYLKYFAYTASDVRRINVFSGQCGAIRKDLFDEVGGYRSVAWGVDIENEELGYRILKRGEIALCRTFRVRHNFPAFRKLLFVFNNRVYWWVLFKHFSKRDETVLMTRGFGYATAALPAGTLCAALAAIVPVPAIALALTVSAMLVVGVFTREYAGFWSFCFRRRGVAFGLAAALASALFAFVVTCGAARGYLAIGLRLMTRKSPPFMEAGPSTETSSSAGLQPALASS